MAITFSELFICLLPGFLGLWVFKQIVQEDIDKRSESTQIAIALLLAMLAFGVQYFIFTLLPDGAAEYISPQMLAFSNSHSGGANFFILNTKFWSTYTCLCLLTMVLAAICGFLRECGINPAQWLSSFVRWCLGRGIRSNCESVLHLLVDDMTSRGYPPSMVRIYNIAGDRDKPLIGFWDGYSESEKEIILRDLDLCDAASDLNLKLEKEHRRCWINHNSGLVVEFVQWDATRKNEFDEYLRAEYRHSLQLSTN